ncbi:2938_t:CDS:2 [Gigaspora margarita]|uniref:2938_t:CDS:1 n=1 Tax=Gigaspora margarita TaxID=4874 RepID=A0ABN7UEH8_GIGMA|nr:2938_t:CDS:2 [Gigaspora margarita]
MRKQPQTGITIRSELNNKMPINPQITDLSIVVAQLNSKLQNKLKLLTKMAIKNEYQIAKRRKKLTKYFFEICKSRTLLKQQDS